MYYKIEIEKSGIGQKSETVKSIKIPSTDKKTLKKQIKNWFGDSEYNYSFVRDKLDETGSYGTAVGQGLSGSIIQVGTNKDKQQMLEEAENNYKRLRDEGYSHDEAMRGVEDVVSEYDTMFSKDTIRSLVKKKNFKKYAVEKSEKVS